MKATRRDRYDAAVAPDLHVGGVDPQVRPVALNRAVEERAHALVDLLAEPAHLALRDTTHAERLDEVVDGAGRDALDVGLLHDGGERLLGEPSRLQEAREVRDQTRERSSERTKRRFSASGRRNGERSSRRTSHMISWSNSAARPRS